MGLELSKEILATLNKFGLRINFPGFHAMASLKGKQHKRYTPSSRA